MNITDYSSFRASQKTFHSSNGKIKYIDQGQGEVILLLHGVPTSGWLYRHMINDLAQNNRVIVPDMLGFGSSDSPKGYEIYSEKNHAQRILDLMEYLSISSWVHVMHDAGGLWTWELLTKEPGKFKKLVVLNTIIYEEGFQPPVRLKPGFIAKIIMWGYRNGITTNMMVKGLFSSGLTNNNLSSQDIEGYKKPLLEGKTKALYYFFTQTCNKLTDYREVLKKIEIPVKIIWGENDGFLLWEPQKNVVAKDLNLSSEDIHLLDAKHFIQEEKPLKIVQLILNFLG